MMDRLRVYVNRVIGFSPLIRNLCHLREFLLCSKTSAKGEGENGGQGQSPEPTSGLVSRRIDGAL